MSSSSIDSEFSRKRKSGKDPKAMGKAKTARVMRCPCKGNRPSKDRVSASVALPVKRSTSSGSLPEVKMCVNYTALNSIFSRVPRVSLIREPLIEEGLKLATSTISMRAPSFNSLTVSGTGSPRILDNVQPGGLGDYKTGQVLKFRGSKVGSCSDTSPKMSAAERSRILSKSGLCNPVSTNCQQSQVAVIRDISTENECKSFFKVCTCSKAPLGTTNSETLTNQQANFPTSNYSQSHVSQNWECLVNSESKLAASKACSYSKISPGTSGRKISTKPVGNGVTFSHLQPRVLLFRDPAIERKLKSVLPQVHSHSETVPVAANSEVSTNLEMENNRTEMMVHALGTFAQSSICNTTKESRLNGFSSSQSPSSSGFVSPVGMTSLEHDQFSSCTVTSTDNEHCSKLKANISTSFGEGKVNASITSNFDQDKFSTPLATSSDSGCCSKDALSSFKPIYPATSLTSAILNSELVSEPEVSISSELFSNLEASMAAPSKLETVRLLTTSCWGVGEMSVSTMINSESILKSETNAAAEIISKPEENTTASSEPGQVLLATIADLSGGKFSTLAVMNPDSISKSRANISGFSDREAVCLATTTSVEEAEIAPAMMNPEFISKSEVNICTSSKPETICMGTTTSFENSKLSAFSTASLEFISKTEANMFAPSKLETVCPVRTICPRKLSASEIVDPGVVSKPEINYTTVSESGTVHRSTALNLKPKYFSVSVAADLESSKPKAFIPASCEPKIRDSENISALGQTNISTSVLSKTNDSSKSEVGCPTIAVWKSVGPTIFPSPDSDHVLASIATNSEYSSNSKEGTFTVSEQGNEDSMCVPDMDESNISAIIALKSELLSKPIPSASKPERMRPVKVSCSSAASYSWNPSKPETNSRTLFEPKTVVFPCSDPINSVFTTTKSRPFLKQSVCNSTSSELEKTYSVSTTNFERNKFCASTETHSDFSSNPERDQLPLFVPKIGEQVTTLDPDAIRGENIFFSSPATKCEFSSRPAVDFPYLSESAFSTSIINSEQEKLSIPDIYAGNSKSQEVVDSAIVLEPKTDCLTSKLQSSKLITNGILSSALKFVKPSAVQYSPSVFKFSKPAAVLDSCDVRISEDPKPTLSFIPETADLSSSSLNDRSDVEFCRNSMLCLEKSTISRLRSASKSEKLQESLIASTTLQRKNSLTTSQLLDTAVCKSPTPQTSRITSSSKPIESPLCTSKFQVLTPESVLLQEVSKSSSVRSHVLKNESVDPVSSAKTWAPRRCLPELLISDLFNRNSSVNLISSREISEPPTVAKVKSIAFLLEHLSLQKENGWSGFGALKSKCHSSVPFSSLQEKIKPVSGLKVSNQCSQTNTIARKTVLSENIDEPAEDDGVILPSDTLFLSAQVSSSEQILRNLLLDLMRKLQKDDECSCDEAMDSSDLMTTDVPYHTIRGCVPVDVLSEREITHDNLEIPSWRHKIFTSCYSMEGTENLSDDVFEKRHARLEQEEKRRKRWDVQRIREQRQLDHLRENERKRNWLAKSDDENDKERPRTCSLYPTVSAATRISVDESLPVNALGVVLKKVEPREFSLPWKDGSTSCGFSYDKDASPRTRRK